MTAETAITAISAALGSVGLWQFIQSRCARRDAVKDAKAKADSVERKALKALLHDSIYHGALAAVDAGGITPDDYENLRYMYDPYHELGGNGTCERLMKEVDKLPILPSKENNND